MTKKKKIISSIIGSIVLVSALVWVGIYTSVIKLPIVKTVTTSAIYPFDIANTKALVANSHNVFVGRVVKQIGTEIEYGGLPLTKFSVEVISNIKGDLRGVVTVGQAGGYKHGKLYVMSGDTMSGSEADEKSAEAHLLQPGATYILAVRTDYENKVSEISAPPYDRALISSDKGLSIAQLKTAAAQNARVQEFMKAAGVTELK